MSASQAVTEKSKAGIVSLSVRSLMINGLQVISVFVLSKWLFPRDYGTFGILNAWIGTAFYFTDIGLTGALIKQAQEPSKEQVQSQLATQMILSGVLCAIFCIFAPFIAKANNLGPEAIWMLRVLGLSLPVYCLRAAPRLLYERRLQYATLAKIDLSEAFVMYCVQITLAIMGAGAWSLIAANLCRSFTGTILLYFTSREFYAPIPSWREIRKLLPFGLPFQANAVLPALHGLVLPLVLAPLLDVKDIGLITWTVGLVSVPVFIATNYNQVLYSSLSRLQLDPAEMKRVASRGTEFTILIFGFIFGLGAACHGALLSLLFDMKWSGARVLMPVAILSVALSTVRYLGAPILNSTGKPHVRLKIEMYATILEFLLAAILTVRFGPLGYLWSAVLVSAVGLVLTAIAVRFSLRRETAVRFAAVLFAASLPFFLLMSTGWWKSLPISLAVFGAGFTGIMALLDSRSKQDSRRVLNDVLSLLKARFAAR